MAAVATAAAAQPVSAQVVANAFVQQYYHILHHSPGLVFRFYQDISKLGRPEDDGSMGITTTMQAINDKILSLNYGDFRAEIKSVDAQESFNGGVHVLVTGYLTGKDNLILNFCQTFFLAPQDRGYFVLNDMFRYVENVSQHDAVQVPVTDAEAPVTPQQIVADPPPVQENHIPEQSTPPAEEADVGEVYNPPENGDVPIVEEEVPVSEVVDEVQDGSEVVVESDTKTGEVPKKSYASIVMHLKESAATFSPPPAPAPRKPMAKRVEQVNQPATTATDGPVSSSDSVDNINDPEGEAADGYSVYIKGLPMSATVALLGDEFKKFGPIKNGGIQVRSNRGFCFGFVEFEVESAVQKAIEASPVLIGGWQAVVEEKRSTNSRGNTRGRFQSGRGAGFRNDGGRGRGNYGGGRGYGRDDFNGRNEFNNRGGSRGGSSNRGGDGYRRTDNTGGRMNRGGGVPNGTAKNMAPRYSATA
ncbi:nuclear transport factor 2-like isoform X3 [Nicotiana tomentosiformis]|uniref:nuclear transport factor 2-like isoform X3 n=1 Tax=Nicotiana tomentosiformis TaxID=4098 RepID=UPI00051C7D96|nr:nuclear transport factor 2-like isoform X3 [Nicotiana tomentosiformis]